MPISICFLGPSGALTEAIARDPTSSCREGHPNKFWILGSQLGSTARALPIVYKLAKDIPPVKAKTNSSKLNPAVDISTYHYLQIKKINLINVNHLVLLCKYSISSTSVRKLNRNRHAT
jgi:hypothetical protein